jgi:ABC-type uncharacterized transport system permease subunit
LLIQVRIYLLLLSFLIAVLLLIASALFWQVALRRYSSDSS